MHAASMQETSAFQRCINAACRATFDLGQTLVACPKCGSLLDVDYDWDRLPLPATLPEIADRDLAAPEPTRSSGVWRFHRLLPFAPLEQCVSVGEGRTMLQQNDRLARHLGMAAGTLHLQYEGLNPSGSFKDNGMAGALTHAGMQGARFAACASTGNTSASLALFAGVTGMVRAIVFVGSGKIAYGKLSQALDYGAITLQIQGDFDDAMARVREVCPQTGIYLVNSLNPFRLEGQKTIMYRVLEGLNWEIPDWIIVPGGNLGNSSAFGKAFLELKQLGLIDRVPRLAVINAAGASTLDRMYNQMNFRWEDGRFEQSRAEEVFQEMKQNRQTAKTLASAIEINLPVNLAKCLRALDVCDGVVRSVTDNEILNHKALVGRHGFGCEPASAASLAGLSKLLQEGVIQPTERVVCILTGHALKDPTATVGYHTDPKWREAHEITTPEWANAPIPVENDLDAIIQAIEKVQ